MIGLDGYRLTRLEEWQRLVAQVEREVADLKDAALTAPSYDRLQYYKGKVEGLERLLILPEELFVQREAFRDAG